MLIKKDVVTGADTKTRLHTKKVTDWKATIGALVWLTAAVAVGRYVILG